jgi:hypothetical protein
MKRAWIEACVLLAVMVAGCKQSAPQPQPPAGNGARDDVLVIPAQWNYTTRDEAGHELTKGSFTMPLSLQAGTQFAGSWQARYVGPEDQQAKIGPQIGGGRLSGELTNDQQIIINLNPSMADNNVRLLGKIDRGAGDGGGHMTGTWTYSNFTGLANHGSFEATLQK